MANNISFLIRLGKIVKEWAGAEMLPEGTTLSPEELEKYKQDNTASLHDLDEARKKYANDIEFIKKILPGLESNYHSDKATQSKNAWLSREQYLEQLTKLDYYQERVEYIDKRIENKDYV